MAEISLTPELVTIYDTWGHRGQRYIPAETIDLHQLAFNIRVAAGRFYVVNNRYPSAIVMPMQLVQQLKITLNQIGPNLFLGPVLQEIAPILAHHAPLDPLFYFL